jgi:hypothetical protein
MFTLSHTMTTMYDRSPFKTHHALTDHPLLQLPKLSALIARLPPEQIFFSSGKVSKDADFDRASIEYKPSINLSSALENLKNADSYIMVRSPEVDKEYALLFNEILHNLKLLTVKNDPDIIDPKLYLFISSPNSITPYHVDRYTTFLMQLTGKKQVHIWHPQDRETVSERDLETLFADRSQRSPFLPKTREHACQTFELSEGEVLHIPFVAPHWVENGPEVSVSLSIIYRTRRTQKKINSYVFNYHLRRKWKLNPRPVGHHMLRDNCKDLFIKAVRRVKKFI